MRADDVARRDGRDLSLIRRLEQLHVPVVSDALDELGIRDRVLAPRIRPLWPSARVAGFAATVEVIPVDAPPAAAEDAYRREIEAVDSLDRADVMVVSTCPRSYWGELLATACRRRGAAGIVADAYTRDSLKLIEMEFPSFVAGIQAQDSLGRLDVSDVGKPIRCGDVEVAPGELVLGDHDGVVVIPIRVADEVLSRAEAKVAVEDEMRRSLRDGMTVADAFATYRVL